MPVKPALVVAAVSLEVAFGAGLAPYALECEARQNPLGIDVEHPRLSWKLRSDERAQSQAAYQILVAASPEKLVPGGADMWDSGKAGSAGTAWIPYAGSRLQPYHRYWWRVRVWAASGAVPAWSDPAEWTMSVLDAYPWENSWISQPDRRLVPGPLPIFRELRTNGAKVGDQVLAPAWTNYRQTVLYESFDVTSMLKSGSNALAALAGATSLTEAWDSDPGSSQDHCMLGHIEEWFFAALGGIRPDPEWPGLSRIQIHPELVGGLTRVDTTWDTFRGPVAVKWHIEGTAFSLRVDIPPGMTAEVYLPASEGSAVTEGGMPLPKAAGVRALRQQGGRRLVRVGSGRYDFQVRGFER